MADYSTISRIAKILARATSPEPNEAKSALDHAYKRMVRDSVTLADLLTLPEAELFQDTIVRLVDVILANQTDLSPSAKRLAYAEYMRLIVAKFSGAEEGASTSRGRSREDDARDYRERHGYKEESPKQEQKNDKSLTQKNEQTVNQKNKKTIFRLIGLNLWHSLCHPGTLFVHCFHMAGFSGSFCMNQLPCCACLVRASYGVWVLPWR